MGDSGYIDLGDGSRSLFYWYFESRNDPKTDPLLIWMSGGPGCSSMLALFSENGPYHVNQLGTDVTLNPYSWNNNATVIWIDQPAGTGFSTGIPVHNEDQVAEDVYEFMQGLLGKYPKYQSLDFYVFGESYAGHYVPMVSNKIITMNQKYANEKEKKDHKLKLDDNGSNFSNERNTIPINFQGAGIGNGLTDPAIQYRYYIPFAEENNLVDDAQLKLMKGILPLCEPLATACDKHQDAQDPEIHALAYEACLDAYLFCNLGELSPVQSTGVNVYDIRKECDPNQQLCYDFTNIDTYLNREDVQKALGVQKETWSDCNPIVELSLVYSGDWMKTYAKEVTSILEAGFKVLIYAGEYDFVCNWMGNSAWAQNLEWTGQKDFIKATNVTISNFGQYKTSDNFTFLKVFNAGHLVPMDQPKNSMDMVNQFMQGKFQPTTK